MTPETERAERRVTRRFPVEQAVVWRNRLSSQALTGRARNVSRLGLQMVVDHVLEIGEEIYISIQHPRTNAWLSDMRGSLVWEKKEGTADSEFPFLVGIKFDDVRSNTERWDSAFQSLELLETTDRLPKLVEQEISKAYDGSTNTFKVLRAVGWGPLVNLGYYNLPAPLTVIEMALALFELRLNNFIPDAQNRLVLETLKEVDIQDGDAVLDVGCGRGRSSFLAASMHSGAGVIGIDLLAANIVTASTLYGGTRNLRYLIDDAMGLRFADEVFDKVVCLESAFHFPKRGRFLEEGYRVLKPGGKLVVIDFMWKTKHSRAISSNPMTELVKGIWRFQDFWTVEEYLETAKDVGFRIHRMRDWSRRVTTPAIFLLKVLAAIGNTGAGRYALGRINPAARALNQSVWTSFGESAAAHVFVEREARYVALSLTKS